MVTIINYNAGNVQSVKFALERLEVQAELTDDPETIRSADKVIFPGVGEAANTMAYLKAKGLDQLIRSLKQPVLGICLGMQLLCEHSEEADTTCLGIITQRVKRFISTKPDIKVPHMGWNAIQQTELGWFDPSVDQQYVYFVHSYYVEKGEYTSALCNYIHPFSAALQKDNFFATQFHPEKSGSVGETILQSFLKI